MKTISSSRSEWRAWDHEVSLISPGVRDKDDVCSLMTRPQQITTVAFSGIAHIGTILHRKAINPLRDVIKRPPIP